MRLLAVMVLFMCWSAAAIANDVAIAGVGGKARPLDGEHRSIRMVREWVRMVVYPDYYDVSAQFVFHNYGRRASVLMGFPEWGVNSNPKYPGFLRFHTWVNGRPVVARRTQARDEGDSYRIYWVKRVAFARGGTSVVRVKYRSRPGDAQAETAACRLASYDFTGGNWKGAVAESSLMVTFHTPGTWVVTADLQHRRGRLSGRWTDWQAKDSPMIHYMSAPPGWMTIPNLPNPFWRGAVWHTVVLPGHAVRPDWLPPALLRQGKPMIQVRLLADVLRAKMQNAGDTSPVSLSWDQGQKEAALSVRGITLRFREGQKAMRLDQGKVITMAQAPFMARQARPLEQSHLYVPLEPVVSLLGGKVEVYKAARRITFTIPQRRSQADDGFLCFGSFFGAEAKLPCSADLAGERP